MALPIVDVVMPSNLAGKQNGMLPDSVLRSHLFPGYKQTAQAHSLAMRAFLAMAAGCYAATGVRLTITSLADAYRSFARQFNAFHQRYEKVSLLTYLITRPSRRKRCDGSYWRLVTGATSACPGTSNHGWGLAFDVALFIAGQIRFITSNKAAWTWIQANARRYGFSWELVSEEWHLRYVDGDDVPDAVLRYEAGMPDPSPDPEPDPEPEPEPPVPPATSEGDDDMFSIAGKELLPDGKVGLFTIGNGRTRIWLGGDLPSRHEAVNARLGGMVDAKTGLLARTWGSVAALPVAELDRICGKLRA